MNKFNLFNQGGQKKRKLKIKITTSSKAKIQSLLICHQRILEDKKRYDDRLVRETLTSILFENVFRSAYFYALSAPRIYAQCIKICGAKLYNFVDFFVHYNDKHMYVYHKKLN